MREYTKKNFYHAKNSDDNTRKYYIIVNGEKVLVDKEIYHICYNSYRKRIRDIRNDNDFGVVSYDEVFDNGLSLLDTIGTDYNYLGQICTRDVLNSIENEIDKMRETDQELIRKIMFDGVIEKELAKEFNVSQQTISRRKNKILNKIKRNLEKKGVLL